MENSDAEPPARTMPMNLFYCRASLIACALLFWTAALVLHARQISSSPAFWPWAACLILLPFAFPSSAKPIRITVKEWLTVGAMTLLFAPLYLGYSFEVPFQIHLDEFPNVRTSFAASIDQFFGLSRSFAWFPAGGFVIDGLIARIFGEVNLENVRKAEALCGLLSLPASYFFLRVFYRHRSALTGSIIVISSHALLGLSRAAVRNSLPVPLLFLAFGFLLRGLIGKDLRKLVAGGELLGLGVYVYYSANFGIAVWAGFLVLCLIRPAANVTRSKARSALFISMLGYLLAAAPMAVSLYKLEGERLPYTQKQTILTPDGRQALLEQHGTDFFWLAYMKSISGGLSVPFLEVPSAAQKGYFNSGHGLFDPFTRIALLAGLWLAFFRKQKKLQTLFGLFGFLTILTVVSFLLVKNPSYARIIAFWPFVILLVLPGLHFTASRLSRAAGFGRPRVIRFALAAIFAANCSAYADYAVNGWRSQDVQGSTVRYVMSRGNLKDHVFVFSLERERPFGPMWADYRLKMQGFLKPTQRTVVIDPALFQSNSKKAISMLPRSNFSLMMSQALWRNVAGELRARYPGMLEYAIGRTGNRVAMEVGKGT